MTMAHPCWSFLYLVWPLIPRVSVSEVYFVCPERKMHDIILLKRRLQWIYNSNNPDKNAYWFWSWEEMLWTSWGFRVQPLQHILLAPASSHLVLNGSQHPSTILFVYNCHPVHATIIRMVMELWITQLLIWRWSTSPYCTAVNWRNCTAVPTPPSCLHSTALSFNCHLCRRLPALPIPDAPGASTRHT